MSTNTIVGVVAGIVVIAGAAYFLMNSSVAPVANTEETATTTPQETQETTSVSGKFNGSLADLAARSGSWKCTVDASTAKSVSSGTTYVSAGKVRADFTTTVQGYGAVQSHMIVDSGYAYSWSSMMPQGIKTKVTARGSGGTATSGQGGDANQAYSYDCEPWTPDTTTFKLPANITFTVVTQN